MDHYSFCAASSASERLRCWETALDTLQRSSLQGLEVTTHLANAQVSALESGRQWQRALRQLTDDLVAWNGACSAAEKQNLWRQAGHS